MLISREAVEMIRQGVLSFYGKRSTREQRRTESKFYYGESALLTLLITMFVLFTAYPRNHKLQLVCVIVAMFLSLALIFILYFHIQWVNRTLYNPLPSAEIVRRLNEVMSALHTSSDKQDCVCMLRLVKILNEPRSTNDDLKKIIERAMRSPALSGLAFIRDLEEFYNPPPAAVL